MIDLASVRKRAQKSALAASALTRIMTQIGLSSSAVILSLSLSASMRAASQAEKPQSLTVGLIEFFPLVTFEKGEPSGFLLDYVQTIFQKLNIEPQFKPISINRDIEQLQNHNLDIVLTLSKTPDREKQVKFSDEPLLVVSSGLCSLSNRTGPPFKKSTRLAHVQGTILPPEFQKLSLMPVSNDRAQMRMLQMLLRGRVEAIYSPRPEVILYAAHQAHVNADVRCYRLKDTRLPIHLGFAPALAVSLRQKINEQLTALIRAKDFDQYMDERLQAAGLPKVSLGEISSSDFP